jgi:hypothetical protein
MIIHVLSNNYISKSILTAVKPIPQTDLDSGEAGGYFIDLTGLHDLSGLILSHLVSCTFIRGGF